MDKRAFLILIIFICVIQLSFAQSLLNLKDKLSSSSGLEKAKIQLQIANLLVDTDAKEALGYSQEALKISKEFKNDEFIANAEFLNAQAFLFLKNYSLAAESGIIASNTFKDNNKKNYALSESLLAEVYLKKSNFPESYKRSLNAYNTFVSLSDNKNAAYSAHDVAQALENQKKNEEAIEWYRKAQTLFNKTGKQKDEIKTQVTISSIYNNYGNYSAAENELKAALEKAEVYGLGNEKQKIEDRLAVIQNNKKSKEINRTSFDIKKEDEQKEYIQNIEHQKAKSLEEIESLSVENQLIELKIKAQQDEYDKNMMLEKIEKLKVEDDLQKEISNKEMIAFELKNEKLLSEKKSIENQRLFISLGALFFITIVVMLAFFNKRKHNFILKNKNEEILKQKDEIEGKNIHINQSIDYATRVQNAILPSWSKLSETHPHSFIYLNPKDKVSGDFFWFHQSLDFTYVAAADCTGHGVPGAFMSIIMSNILDKVVKEQKCKNPDEILQRSAVELTNMILERGYNLIDFKDGMDIALVKIDLKNMELSYSGAHNPAYIVRNKELVVLKPSRNSVNVILPGQIPNSYSIQKYKLEKGDRIFVFSDGFPDQKGGSERTKFYYPPFRQLLAETSDLSIENQKNTISNKFQEWKGKEEQIDDVLVVGFEI